MKSKTFLYVLFTLYMLCLVYLLFLKNQSPLNFMTHGEIHRSINLVPFLQIKNYLISRHSMPGIVFFNVIGNILIFVPLGAYLPYFNRYKNFVLNFILIIVISVAVEAVQYATGLGAGDVDDVILNSAGGFLGIVMYKMGAVIMRRARK